MNQIGFTALVLLRGSPNLPYFFSLHTVCQTGFWGEQCEHPCECTGTKDQTCDSKTGKCLGGCSTDGDCPEVAGMGK